MHIQRLSWAGVFVESKGTGILIDPLGTTPSDQENPFAARLGTCLIDFVPIDVTPVHAICITHIHADHFDAASIQQYYGKDIHLILPYESVGIAKKLGFTNVTGVKVGDSVHMDSLTITASYAVDGFGTPQVSYVIRDNDITILHSGDTLWHGYWWKMQAQFQNIDIAFLPINGAVLQVDGLARQSDHHACLNPEEAVEAAFILQASTMIPIHYGAFHNPPYYIETAEVERRVLDHAKNKHVKATILQPGEYLE